VTGTNHIDGALVDGVLLGDRLLPLDLGAIVAHNKLFATMTATSTTATVTRDRRKGIRLGRGDDLGEVGGQLLHAREGGNDIERDP